MLPTIALLTDFGLEDTFVGVMKGVIARICPDARVIDLTHAIPPQDVRQGAVALMNSCAYFPAGTVFTAVVDPGVGSARRAVAVEAGEYFFVAPDNGLISYAAGRAGIKRAVVLTEQRYWLDEISASFHGRDIFAPVSAHLACGVDLSQLGHPIDDVVMLPAPRLQAEDGMIVGEVLLADHFGNLLTSIGPVKRQDSERVVQIGGETYHLDPERTRIEVGGTVIEGIVTTFSAVPSGGLLAMVGSSGYLEIAVNRGSAATVLDVRAGAPVRVKRG